ncbi:MAG: nucleotide exchange factor GrpE [Lachnospiraceae bacterium]
MPHLKTRKGEQSMTQKNKTEETNVSQEHLEEVDTEQETVPTDETEETPGDSKDAQIDDLKDRLSRQMAEFDNFRKRTEKEKSAMYEIGARDFIEKILPVLDNFERGLTSMPEDAKGSAFAEGIEMIYKQFVKTLEDTGVEAIEALGQQFDPNLHNAVLHVEDDSFAENEITQEMQKGYKYRGTVIRHSMVQVAN